MQLVPTVAAFLVLTVLAQGVLVQITVKEHQPHIPSSAWPDVDAGQDSKHSHGKAPNTSVRIRTSLI